MNNHTSFFPMSPSSTACLNCSRESDAKKSFFCMVLGGKNKRTCYNEMGKNLRNVKSFQKVCVSNIDHLYSVVHLRRCDRWNPWLTIDIVLWPVSIWSLWWHVQHYSKHWAEERKISVMNQPVSGVWFIVSSKSWHTFNVMMSSSNIWPPICGRVPLPDSHGDLVDKSSDKSPADRESPVDQITDQLQMECARGGVRILHYHTLIVIISNQCRITWIEIPRDLSAEMLWVDGIASI